MKFLLAINLQRITDHIHMREVERHTLELFINEVMPAFA